MNISSPTCIYQTGLVIVSYIIINGTTTKSFWHFSVYVNVACERGLFKGDDVSGENYYICFICVCPF